MPVVYNDNQERCGRPEGDPGGLGRAQSGTFPPRPAELRNDNVKLNLIVVD